jgi:uncharacterized protein
MFKPLGFSLLVLVSTVACATAPTAATQPTQSTQSKVPTEQQARQLFSLQTLNIGELNVVVQVADTPEKRSQGLMFQHTAKPGMLLLYQSPGSLSLWMRNTTMPLDVAFIGPDWTIIQIEQLQPLDETPVAAISDVIAALEMPQGWFKDKQIGIGAAVKLLD